MRVYDLNQDLSEPFLVGLGLGLVSLGSVVVVVCLSWADGKIESDRLVFRQSRDG